VPEGRRVYAIGDIHGRADLLKRLQRKILQDVKEAPALENTVVYLGDYLDRGPFVFDTLDHVISGLDCGFEIIYLRGNHEQLFLDFLDNPSMLPVWLGLGGLATLMSYGVYPGHFDIAPQRAAELRDALVANMPDQHLHFLRSLHLYLHLGDYLFVHAGLRPGVPLVRQTLDDLLWIREEFIAERHGFDFKVVHGHTIDKQPQQQHHRLGIDTGAYATGILTCAVFEEDQVRFLDTDNSK
jgi:serine/threonine protein phosphatase 1